MDECYIFSLCISWSSAVGYIDLFSSDSVSLDKDKYISEIKKDMNELGYDTENLSFQAIPLSVDAMKKLKGSGIK